MTALLVAHPAIFAAVAAVLGLVVGSFLNVVIVRLPQMMEREWDEECRAFMHEQGGNDGAQEEDEEPFNLVRPPSTCPRCGHRIRPWENIPLLSWIIQRGRCTSCREPISIQYPLVEAAAAVVAAAVAWRFGFGWEATAAIILSWSLLTVAVIDLRTQLLPDSITLPLLWLGLLLNTGALFTPLPDAVVGAAVGYLSLWSVYHLFRLLTGKEGMGHGDFKLLAALGGWLGWQMLPSVILLSALLGAVVGIALIVGRDHDRRIPIPYGPWLAAAGWVALMWGETINRTYLDLVL